jgi:hypothetical protein
MAKDHGYLEIEQRVKESRSAYVASTAFTSTINDAISQGNRRAGALHASVRLLGDRNGERRRSSKVSAADCGLCQVRRCRFFGRGRG